MEEPNDREQQDRMFLEQMLISVRGLRGRIGLGQGSEPIIQRAFALVLMREALAALDAVGDTDVAPNCSWRSIACWSRAALRYRLNFTEFEIIVNSVH
ncbi:hypothetical protein [Sphingobium chungbukense]|uniref:hypothetical protein n=1 Tax=Sphingobium chungbukense TaxID=56193 RepID=UPI001E42239F|nr:hypothetical protein [Sphingobium chungbukense]